MRLASLSVAVAALVAAFAVADTGAVSDGCLPSRVLYRDIPAARDIGFYGRTPPWVVDQGVVGFLFYYGMPPFGRMHSARAYVTTDGEVGRTGSTKILWWFRRTAAAGGAVTITGRRLDADGSFRSTWRTRVVGPSFPSYLVVPHAGCWRVEVSSGRARAQFVFGAFRDSAS